MSLPSPASELRTVLSAHMPRRFAQRLCEHWLGDRPLRQFDEPALARAPGFAFAVTALYGLLSGLFAARTLRVLRLARPAPALAPFAR